MVSCAVTSSSNAVALGRTIKELRGAPFVAYGTLLFTFVALSFAGFAEPFFRGQLPLATALLMGLAIFVGVLGMRTFLQIAVWPVEVAIFDREGVMQQTWHGMRIREGVSGLAAENRCSKNFRKRR